MAKGKKVSWRDKVKSAQKMSAKNGLTGGSYPLVYIKKLYAKESYNKGEMIVLEARVLESEDLVNTEYAAKRGSDKMVTILAKKPGENIDIIFMVQQYEAALSNLVGLMDALEPGIDVEALGEKANDISDPVGAAEASAEFEGLLDKVSDPDGDNPYYGRLISIDAPVGYTKDNGVLIPYTTFEAVDDDTQAMATDLLASVMKPAAAAESDGDGDAEDAAE